MTRSFTKSRFGKRVLKDDLRKDLEQFFEALESGAIVSVASVAALQLVLTDNFTAQAAPAVISAVGTFYWNPTSTAAHNGTTVIRPTVGAAATGAGRWVTTQSEAGPLDLGGNAITNYANASSAANLALTANTSTPFPAYTLSGLAASSIYQVEFQFEVGLSVDSDHTINGAITWTVQATISTNGSGVATVTFNTTPVPNISYLPTGLAGATATVAASTGGFTISVTRPTGVACHAWYYVYWVRIKNVT